MDDKELTSVIERAVHAAVEAQSTTDQLLTQRLDALVKLVEKHDHTLYGNGKEGLTSIVDRIERAVETAQGIWNKLVGTLVVAGVIGLIILLVQANLLKP